jgi:hypothetical protein
MTTKTQMADALEQAADMYETEKVEWCDGTWFLEAEPDTDLKLSVCASTALGMACGLSMDEAQVLEAVYCQWTGMVTQGYELYVDTRLHVDRVLGSGDPERILVTLPEWNDAGAKDKSQVIEMFKEIAKDLRNEG